MLQYEQWIPPTVKDGAPLIVLLHGRGSHMGDLMGLQPFLPQEAMVVAPQAPFSGTPWGYGPGWAWYRFLSGNRPEPESFDVSLQALGQFLTELQLPAAPGSLALGGFSQGGVTSMAYALRNPGQVSHCLNFSGFFPDHPGIPLTPESVAGTRFFWGHGKQDPMIPFELAREGREKLRAAGADLTVRDHPGGHSIEQAELQDAVAWLREG